MRVRPCFITFLVRKMNDNKNSEGKYNFHFTICLKPNVTFTGWSSESATIKASFFIKTYLLPLVNSLMNKKFGEKC